MKKRIISAISFLVMAVMLTACSPSTTPDNNDTMPGDGVNESTPTPTDNSINTDDANK